MAMSFALTAWAPVSVSATSRINYGPLHLSAVIVILASPQKAGSQLPT
jgi:hypothetical protein